MLYWGGQWSDCSDRQIQVLVRTDAHYLGYFPVKSIERYRTVNAAPLLALSLGTTNGVFNVSSNATSGGTVLTNLLTQFHLSDLKAALALLTAL